MDVTLKILSFDPRLGTVTASLSPQEVNRMNLALGELLNEAPVDGFEALIGMSRDTVYQLCTRLVEARKCIPVTYRAS